MQSIYFIVGLIGFTLAAPQTVTIDQNALLLGLVGAGALGVAKGLATSQILDRRERRRRNRRFRRRRFRNGKRSADEDEEDNEIEDLFVEALDLDSLSCVKKIVCRLSAGDSAVKMTPEEELLATLFGSEGKSFSESPKFGEMNLAADVGRLKGAEACDKYFSLCHFDFKDLLQQFREHVQHEREDLN